MDNLFIKTESQANLNKFLGKTYGFMGLAVAISALSAYVVLAVAPQLALSRSFGWISFVICLAISYLFDKATVKNPATGMLLLVFFSILEGISLSCLAFAYTGATIGGAFVSASAIFLGMAFLGATTKIDLSRWGAYLFVGVLGVLIVSLVNILLFHSTGLAFVLPIISVILFTAYTAYDAQFAAHSYRHLELMGISENSMAIINAFSLYLDFINLFVDLVQIFGGINNDN